MAILYSQQVWADTIWHEGGEITKKKKNRKDFYKMTTLFSTYFLRELMLALGRALYMIVTVYRFVCVGKQIF